MRYIRRFKNLSMKDVPSVGGKNAALGEMIAQLSTKGIRVPLGFAVTADAYWYFLSYNKIFESMKTAMARLTDKNDLVVLREVGKEIRTLIENGEMPEDLAQEIIKAYHELSQDYNQENVDVAVRSSATAEDLPEASFAGQQDTFLNIKGTKNLLEACKKSMASLFTNRAIIYREEKGFDHFKVALSVGVQKMIRSDLASAGVIFTLDTETGFKDIVMINSAFGLGEVVVKGKVNPDEFRVFKPTLKEGFRPIIKKHLGDKPIKLIYAEDPYHEVTEVTTGNKEYNNFSLTDDEIIELAQASVIIEDHYSEKKGGWLPMDIEWAKDGIDKKLYILQARPETVHAPQEKSNFLLRFSFKNVTQDELKAKLLVQGQSIGESIATGVARVAQNINDLTIFDKGDILITTMTDPDWVPIMKKAAAIITDRGGRTSHAAIVSRELGIPAVVGTDRATSKISEEQKITVDCSRGTTGYVYDGQYEIEKEKIDIAQLPQLQTNIFVNIADPDRAIPISFLPVDGVGLARIEFIISNQIKIHPMVAVKPEAIEDEVILKEVAIISRAYPNARTFFIDTLAQGIGSIAAAFYPRPVIVRLSDFKTNEYRNLIGGKYFEPKEENPMLGLRGASRYYNELYEPAFALECEALKKVRNQMGFTNVFIMIPFIRTVHEAKKVIDIIAKNGLKRHENELQLYMMCEIPSNVIIIDEFAKLFDGISIGSNDLTQMTLAVDRDSDLLAPLFDERDEAVKQIMKLAVEGAKRNNIRSGICGQAPSDYPEIGDFLIKIGIDSISLNPDSVLPFLMRFKKQN
ncbi:MAG: phosphoenolpyruvate synthase [Candidatus Babeliales bacterium]